MVGRAFEVVSSKSNYKILVQSQPRDYTMWSAKCCGEFSYPFHFLLKAINYKLVPKLYFSDIGCGWGPAVLNEEREIYIIREAVNGSYDNRRYWIGGTSDDPHDSIILHSDYYTDRSGSHYILI